MPNRTVKSRSKPTARPSSKAKPGAAPGKSAPGKGAPGKGADAAPFESAEGERFLAAVFAEFERRKMPFKFTDGYIVPRMPAGQPGHGMSYGLTNLAQVCAAAGEKKWGAAIRKHFDGLFAAEAKHEAMLKDLEDYAKVRTLLVVRVFDAADAAGEGLKLVTMKIAPGLVGALCIDLPEVTRSVSPETVRKWKKSATMLFAEAMDNVERMSKAKLELLPREDDGVAKSPLYGVVGKTIYTAALAMRIGSFKKAAGKHGTIVGVPTRDSLILAPFDDETIVPTISDLMFIAAGMHREGPGSVTSKVFLVQDGVWTEIPYTLDEGGLEVRPPKVLVKTLEACMPAGKPAKAAKAPAKKAGGR